MLFKLIGNNTDEVRVKWVRKNLQRIPKGSKLLDAGAGELRFKSDCKHLDYVAQDFGQYQGTGDEGLQTGNWDNTHLDIVSDITDIPVEDESFDALLCTEVLEHVPDAVAALNEFSRVLKPGGILLITAPFASLTHFAPYHFGGYSKYWYEYHLPGLDFDIKIIEHNGSWFHFIAQELRRSRFMGAMYSSKILGLITRVAVVPILVLLTILSRFDRGSDEALCFNYMVRAVKK
jgi:SAM-dependent methyltransferase